MEFGNLNEVAIGVNFKIFDSQEVVLGLSVLNEQFFRKQIDDLIDFSKSHEEGANGIVWVNIMKIELSSRLLINFSTQKICPCGQRF